MKIFPVMGFKSWNTVGLRGDSRRRGTSAPMTTRQADRWRDAGVEPCLTDLLADPILHLLLRRDGLTVADVCVAVERGRAALAQRASESEPKAAPARPCVGRRKASRIAPGPLAP